MSVRTFLMIGGIIGLVFGLGFLLMPAALASLYNIRLDDSGAYIGQLFGAALLTISIINLTLSNAAEINHILLGNFIGNTLGFLVSLLAMINQLGGVNSLGWLTVVIYLFLAVGSAYYRFFAQGSLKRVTR